MACEIPAADHLERGWKRFAFGLDYFTLPHWKGDDYLCRLADVLKTWKESIRPLWRRRIH